MVVVSVAVPPRPSFTVTVTVTGTGTRLVGCLPALGLPVLGFQEAAGWAAPLILERVSVWVACIRAEHRLLAHHDGAGIARQLQRWWPIGWRLRWRWRRRRKYLDARVVADPDQEPESVTGLGRAAGVQAVVVHQGSAEARADIQPARRVPLQPDHGVSWTLCAREHPGHASVRCDQDLIDADLVTRQGFAVELTKECDGAPDWDTHAHAVSKAVRKVELTGVATDDETSVRSQFGGGPGPC